jgi:heat shock protein HslJ
VQNKCVSRRRLTHFLSGLLPVVLLSSCTGSSDRLVDRMFVSSAVTEDGRPVSLAPGTRFSIRFGDDRWFEASAGCNVMGARLKSESPRRLDYEEKGQTTTLMGCPDRSEQEGWFSRLLQSKPFVEAGPGRLVLVHGNQRAEFVERTGDPRAELVGPTWTVVARVAADVATPFQKDDAPQIVFGEASYEERAGCVRGLGILELERGAIRNAGWTSSTPPGCVPTPGVVLPLLPGGRLTFDRAGDTVQLRSDRGDGLDLVGPR